MGGNGNVAGTTPAPFPACGRCRVGRFDLAVARMDRGGLDRSDPPGVQGRPVGLCEDASAGRCRVGSFRLTLYGAESNFAESKSWPRSPWWRGRAAAGAAAPVRRGGFWGASRSPQGTRRGGRWAALGRRVGKSRRVVSGRGGSLAESQGGGYPGARRLPCRSVGVG